MDLELLLNQIEGIFKPDEEAPENDDLLQATMSAQVRKTNNENRGAATYDRNVPKKNQESRSPKPEPSDISKLKQVVFDLKAEMGSMRKAMARAGISFDKSPNMPRPRKQTANGKQKGKFAGKAKMKNKTNKVPQRSRVPVPCSNEVSDSNDDPQPEYGQVAIVVKPQKKHVSPRTINAMLVGMTHHDPDRLKRITESEASVDRASSSDEVDARTSVNWSLNENFFDEPDVHKALESRDAMDQQGDTQED